jgi:phenylalanyl-tRNA synthetase alpha chain
MSGEAPKDLDARREETLGAISGARDPAALEEVRVRTLGKSGWLTEKLKELGKLAAEQRKEVGARVNRVREELQAFIEDEAARARNRRRSPRS